MGYFALHQLDVSYAQSVEVPSCNLQHRWRIIYANDPLHARGKARGHETCAGPHIHDRRVLIRPGDLGHLLDDALVVVSKAHGVPVGCDALEEGLDIFSRCAHVKRLLFGNGWFLSTLLSFSSFG